eukprot:2923833-Rhodomonas_salina.3
MILRCMTSRFSKAIARDWAAITAVSMAWLGVCDASSSPMRRRYAVRPKAVVVAICSCRFVGARRFNEENLKGSQ